MNKEQVLQIMTAIIYAGTRERYKDDRDTIGHALWVAKKIVERIDRAAEGVE